MARRVVHEVRVTPVQASWQWELPGASRTQMWCTTGEHLWNPITEHLEPYEHSHLLQETVRNTLVARGYVEVLLEHGQRDQWGRFEALVPVQGLQRVHMRPVKRARGNPRDIDEN